MKEMLEKPLPVNKTAPATFAGPAYPPIERRAATFDPKALQRLLDGDNAEIRNSIKQLITQPEFRYYDGNDVASQRRNVLAWTKRIADTGIGRIFLPRSVGGDENVPKFMAAFETLTFHDISLVIKLGVQFGLFAGSIQQHAPPSSLLVRYGSRNGSRVRFNSEKRLSSTHHDNVQIYSCPI